MTTQDRCLILDGHAIIYRAYHAFKDLSDPEGAPINAVYGFTRILLKVLEDFRPLYIAVAFDHKHGKSKRSEQFKEYKAQRPPMPDDLISQIDKIKEMVHAFAIPQFELDGFEADDILGTIARLLASNERVHTTIVTGDKDLLQLVVDGVTSVFIPGRGKFSKDVDYNSAALVAKKMGVLPNQIPDLKALMGDSSDNIPGVKGIGPTIAGRLIQQFGSLEAIYEQLEKNPEPTTELKKGVIDKLFADKKMAFLSKELTTIDTMAPVSFELTSCVAKEYNKQAVSELFERYNFNSLAGMLPKDAFEIAVQKALF